MRMQRAKEALAFVVRDAWTSRNPVGKALFLWEWLILPLLLLIELVDENTRKK